MPSPQALLEQNREAILRLAEDHSARNVRVFGSIAKRQAGPDSDVDLLVEMEPGRNLLDFVGLWQDLVAYRTSLIGRG